jgi:hypothetical protein
MLIDRQTDGQNNYNRWSEDLQMRLKRTPHVKVVPVLFVSCCDVVSVHKPLRFVLYFYISSFQ